MFSLSGKGRIFSALAMMVSIMAVPMQASAADTQEETKEVYQFVSKVDTWMRSSQIISEKNKVVHIPKGWYIQTLGEDENGWTYAVCLAEDDVIYGGWIPKYQFQSAGFAPPEENLAPPLKELRVFGKVEELEHPPMPKDDIEELPTPPAPAEQEEILPNPPAPADMISTTAVTKAVTKTTTKTVTAAVTTATVTASSVKAPSDVGKSEVKQRVWNYLTGELGFNRAAACAIMVNINEESGFKPYLEITDTNDLLSIGLFQWNGERCDAFKNFCDVKGWEYGSVDAQLAFLKQELTTSRKKQYQTMLSFENSASGCYDAAYYWASSFEVCSRSRWEARAADAEIYFSKK